MWTEPLTDDDCKGILDASNAQLHAKNKGNSYKSMMKIRAQVTKHYGLVQPLHPLVIKYVRDHRGGRDVNICSVGEISCPLRSKQIPMVNGIKENEPMKKTILSSISNGLEFVVTFRKHFNLKLRIFFSWKVIKN